jgi:hypothetical protein
MNILVVATKPDEAAKIFMGQFQESRLLNDTDPDLLIWLCKSIVDTDAAKIQDYSGVIASHFITL